MEELSVSEVNAISGGDGVMAASGTVVGVATGALVIGTAGGILAGAILGAAIWGGGYYIYTRFQAMRA
jgi:hypothetical protein